MWSPIRTHYFMNTSFELRSSDLTSVLSIYRSMFFHLYIVFTWRFISTSKCPTCRFLESSLFEIWYLIERNFSEQVRVRQVFSRALIGVVLDTLFSSSSSRESGRVSFLTFYRKLRRSPLRYWKRIRKTFINIFNVILSWYYEDWSSRTISTQQS